MADGSSFEMGEKYRKKSWETIYLLTQKFCLPLMKGGRGMFHRTCDTMRTEHPPSPLHKGEVKVSSNILLPLFKYTVMKEKTMFHQLTDLYIEALELEIQKKER